jgi:hypothetical protein
MQKMLITLGPLFFLPRNVRQFHGYPLRQAKYSMLNLKIILEESLRGMLRTPTFSYPLVHMPCSSLASR